MMLRMTMNPRTITPSGKEQLLALAAGPDAVMASRAKIVLLILDGHEAGGIAQDQRVSERTVHRVVKRYDEGGVDSLTRRTSPGRPQSITPAQRAGVMTLIRRLPDEFGFSTERWTLAVLAAVAKREGVLGEVSTWTLRRELARIIQLEPALEEQVSLPGQSRPGAPRGNGNALRHGACGRQPRSGAEHALLAEIEADLRRDFPGAGQAGAGLIGEAAIAYLQFCRTITADFREADRRAILRWRKALRALKAAEKKPKAADAPKITPAEWASDLVARYRKYEMSQNGTLASGTGEQPLDV